MRGFNPFFFDQPSKCDGVKAIMNERAALHFKGFTYTGEVVRCENPFACEDLMAEGFFEYSSKPDARCGWDKSGFVFLCGATPAGKAPPVAPLALEK